MVNKKLFATNNILALPSVEWQCQIVPSQCLAQPMTMPLALVRYWVEQAVYIVGQPSGCCMVCLMPRTQLSGSLEFSHVSMFTLDGEPVSVGRVPSPLFFCDGIFQRPVSLCERISCSDRGYQLSSFILLLTFHYRPMIHWKQGNC